MATKFYGTLNDIEIKNAVDNEKLIEEGYEEKNIKQACYELRAGNTYFDLSKNVAEGGEKHEIPDDGVIIFRPHQTIVIITKEKLKIPNDILARVLTKGILFSVGLSPVNTYADPGFHGHLGIVLNNTSNNYLKIKCGETIAKIEFDRLMNPVNTPYYGQHSFETGIWPVRTEFLVKRESIGQYISKPTEIEEIEYTFGKPVADIMERILRTERQFIFATIVLFTVNLALIAVTNGAHWLSNIQSAIVGTVTNIVFFIISLVIQKKK